MLLKRGSRGENVKKVQKFLGINADGIYGQQTEEAVKAYQKRKGLKVDGIVGTQTWNSMFGSGSSTGGATVGGGSSTAEAGGMLNMVVGGILLYGVFKVLMKVF